MFQVCELCLFDLTTLERTFLPKDLKYRRFHRYTVLLQQFLLEVFQLSDNQPIECLFFVVHLVSCHRFLVNNFCFLLLFLGNGYRLTFITVPVHGCYSVISWSFVSFVSYEYFLFQVSCSNDVSCIIDVYGI